mgnify:FL=1
MWRWVGLLSALTLATPAVARQASPPLSLVIARVLNIAGSDPLEFDQGCGDEECPDRRPMGFFDRVELLYGDPLPGDFRATIGARWSFTPRPPHSTFAILAVKRGPSGDYEVVAYGFSDSVACIEIHPSYLTKPDWRPKGHAFKRRDGSLCADVRHLARKP